MRFGAIDHPLTGVAVPVSALRSRRSCGVGEYPDLARSARGRPASASTSSSSCP